MKKKIVAIVLIAIVSAGLGYTVAYIQGLLKVNDMEVRTYCHILLLQSLALSSELDIPTTAGLIDAAERNCRHLSHFIVTNEPFCNSDTQELIKQALTAWERAKRKLEELRSLQVKGAKDSKTTSEQQNK